MATTLVGARIKSVRTMTVKEYSDLQGNMDWPVNPPADRPVILELDDGTIVYASTWATPQENKPAHLYGEPNGGNHHPADPFRVRSSGMQVDG